MPYIAQKDRSRIVETDGLNQFGLTGGSTHTTIHAENIIKAGELNYAITEMIITYLNRKGISYTNMNEVVGVLECAKLELYRRMTAPYEDQKISENGDVYPEQNKE